MLYIKKVFYTGDMIYYIKSTEMFIARKLFSNPALSDIA